MGSRELNTSKSEISDRRGTLLGNQIIDAGPLTENLIIPGPTSSNSMAVSKAQSQSLSQQTQQTVEWAPPPFSPEDHIHDTDKKEHLPIILHNPGRESSRKSSTTQ